MEELPLMMRLVVGSIPHGGHIELFLYDWCNKGHGMCYTVCGMGHIKEPLLLIRIKHQLGPIWATFGLLIPKHYVAPFFTPFGGPSKLRPISFIEMRTYFFLV